MHVACHVCFAENVDDEHCASLPREAVTPVNGYLGVKGTMEKKVVDVLDNPLHLSMSTPCHQQLPAFKGECRFLERMQRLGPRMYIYNIHRGS